MKGKIVQLTELQYPYVSCYSIILNNNSESEFTDFQIRMANNQNDRVALSEMNELIARIGHIKIDGKREHFFKCYTNAERIRQITPESFNELKPDPKDYGLRLYLYRITPTIIVFFNGDRKTFRKVEECPRCGKYFDRADKIAAALIEAYYARDIEIDGNDILTDDNFTLKIQQ